MVVARKHVSIEVKRLSGNPDPAAGPSEILRVPAPRLLSIVGTAHSEATDVSSDKLKHLGDAYGDNP